MTTTPARNRRDRCTCNLGPDTEGPEQDCPAHGDPLIFADEVDRLRKQASEVRAAALTDHERQFLTFALDLAFDRMVSDDGFTDEDDAALESLRRMAAAARPDNTAYDRRTWEGWRRDAGCGCTAPNPAECTADCEPRVTRQCACHYLTHRPDDTTGDR